MIAGACIFHAGKMIATGAAMFTLTWVHSVERTEWRETWQVAGRELILLEARVKGSGAGMDPGEGARLEDGWWIWSPDLPPVEVLVLAGSGSTMSGWKICTDDVCEEIPASARGETSIRPCRNVPAPPIR